MVGVSRSVTIVIAYLLKKYRYSLGQVVNMLQRRRHKVPRPSRRSTPTPDFSNNFATTPNNSDSRTTSSRFI